MKRSEMRKFKNKIKNQYSVKRQAQKNGESIYDYVDMVFGGKFNEWKPKAQKQKHQCVIVPYFTGRYPSVINKNLFGTSSGDPTFCFRHVIHRNVGTSGKDSMLCLKQTYGKYCKACDELYNDKNGLYLDYEKNQERIKPIRPKHRIAWNVLVISDDEEKEKGSQLWRVAYSVKEQYKGWAEQIDDVAEDPDTDRYDDETGLILYWDWEEQGRIISFTQLDYEEAWGKMSNVALKKRDYSVEEYMAKAYIIEDLVTANFVWNNDKVDWAATEQKFIEFYEGDNVEFQNDDPESADEDYNQEEHETIEVKSDKEMPWDEDKENSDDSDDNESQIVELKKLDLDEMSKEELLKVVEKYSVLSSIKKPEGMGKDQLWDAIDDIVDA